MQLKQQHLLANNSVVKKQTLNNEAVSAFITVDSVSRSLLTLVSE